MNCPICGKEFEKKKSMTNHKRWHDLPEYKAYQEKERKRERICSMETRKRLSEGKLGRKNPNWKGDDAKYAAIHLWVTTRKPKPDFCIKCLKNPSFDLHNISGEYKRDLDDWEWLCRSCHMKLDGRMNKRDDSGKWVAHV